MKIEVTNTRTAMSLLAFYSIKAVVEDSTIIVSKADYQSADNLLKEWKPEWNPASSQPKEKAQRKSQGARPTLASKGLRRKAHLSATVDAEAKDWLTNCIKPNELISHTLSRIIMEHKTMTELREFE